MDFKKIFLFFLLFSFLLIIFSFYFILKDKEEKPILKEQNAYYDVIVFGNEPESIASAIASSRSGMKTLLLTKEGDKLGGLFTEAQLNYLDIPTDDNGKLLAHSIFIEFWKELDKKNTLNVEKIEDTFEKMIKKENNLIHLSGDYEVHFEENKKNKTKFISHVSIKQQSFSSQYYIDGTGDGLVVRNHVSYFDGREEFGLKEKMAVTLVLPIHGVDVDMLKEEAKNDLFGGAEFSETAIWGFVGMEEGYKEHFDDTNVRKMNIGIDYKNKNKPIVYINALQVYNIDPNNEESVKYGYERAKEESEYFLTWMNENFPSFKDAYYSEENFPNKLYIRESVHYKTASSVTIEDVWNSNIPKDVVALGSYPVDIQGTSKYAKNHIIINPDYYGIGYGSSVLPELDNVFIVGKTAGYDALAFGSSRIVPTGMALAEAVGYSLPLLDKNKTVFENYQKLDFIEALQNKLIKEGGTIYFNPSDYIPYSDYIYFDEIMYLLSKGFLWSDYDNDLSLKENASLKETVEYFNYINQNSIFNVGNLSDIENDNNLILVKEFTEKIPEFNQIITKYNFNSVADSFITNEMIYLYLYEKFNSIN